MASLNVSVSQVHAALSRLHQRWEDAQSQWSDSVQRCFEKTYLMPLEDQVMVAQREMERVAQLIEQARQSVK